MTTALVSSSGGLAAPRLLQDLASVGMEPLLLPNCTNLLQQVIKESPDLVVVFESAPDAAFFESAAAIDATAPRPVVVFTTDPDVEKIALAIRSGIHAYVINGYGQDRLRSVIHLAQARFRHERLIREQLAEVNQRFSERKLVDRARGILMGARQLREEEAYRALRSAAMQGKQRIGQVAQRVIDSARYAEAINRAGQLRMLSQRIAKLYALACAGILPDTTGNLLAGSVVQVEANFATLSRNLSRPTFGDLLDAAETPWKRLRQLLQPPHLPSCLLQVDRQAEQMLLRAEQLTANLEIAGLASALHVINVSGRQRMLSQRLAKEALIGSFDGAPASAALQAAMRTTIEELSAGFAYLQALPLSNLEIAHVLAEATQTWEVLRSALPEAGNKAGQETIAAVSETLLDQFERLTDHIERGMQSLVH